MAQIPSEAPPHTDEHSRLRSTAYFPTDRASLLAQSQLKNQTTHESGSRPVKEPGDERNSLLPENEDDIRRARIALRRYLRSLPPVVQGQTWYAELSMGEEVRLLPGTRLPAGVHFGHECRALYGTPEESGQFWVEFAEGASGQTRRWQIVVVPAPPLAIAAARLPVMRCNEAVQFPFELTAQQAESVRWSVAEGWLPPGVFLSHDGKLFGMPSEPGLWCCVIAASVGSRTVVATLSIVVDRPLEAKLTLLKTLQRRRADERLRVLAARAAAPDVVAYAAAPEARERVVALSRMSERSAFR